MFKILAIDPSGTGTTGVCLVNQKITFKEFQSKEWKEHLNFLIREIETYHPNIILYESTNYINCKGKDMTSLLKLIGGLEGLTYTFTQIQQIENLPVNQIKELKSKVFKGVKKIKDLTFEQGRGKGWTFNNKKISVHQLDAFLVYYIWKAKGGNHA